MGRLSTDHVLSINGNLINEENMMTTPESLVPTPSPDDDSITPIDRGARLVTRPARAFLRRRADLAFRDNTYKQGMILLLLMGIMMLQLAASIAPRPGDTMVGAVAVTPPSFVSAPNSSMQPSPVDRSTLLTEINPATGYLLPARFGNLGPRLLAVGAIDPTAFMRVYQGGGRSLNDLQTAILGKGSDTQVVVDSANAYFLLNFFWAVGLTNRNPILTQLTARYGIGGVSNFASTGGWTLGTKNPMELYNIEPLIVLSPEQQTRLETVASGVFRPCCANPTMLPDCNHGMAMLGLLELMASQDATVNQMYVAAKYVNAFWFPQQTLEVATFLKASQNVDFASADPRAVVGNEFFSGPGFAVVHRWLAARNLLPASSSGQGSCGVG